MTSTPENPVPRPSAAASGRLKRRLGRAELTFDASVLEILVDRDPENAAHLTALSALCTRLRRYRRGLEVGQRLIAAEPDEPQHRYRLACTLSLSGDVAAACEELLAAIRLGYRDLRAIERDADLRRLRDDPCFALVRDELREAHDND